MQPPLEFSKKTPLTRRCENAKKRLFGGSCFAAWNIISAKNFFAESLWFIDDQGPHFEGMIASTINTWLFSKNCVAYLRFLEICVWNIFGTKCYTRFNMFNFAFPPQWVLLSNTSEILKQLYRFVRRCKKSEKIWPVNLHKTQVRIDKLFRFYTAPKNPDCEPFVLWSIFFRNAKLINPLKSIIGCALIFTSSFELMTFFFVRNLNGKKNGNKTHIFSFPSKM